MTSILKAPKLLISLLLLPVFLFFQLSHANASLPLPTDKLVNYVYIGELTKDQARIALDKTPPLNTLAVNYSLELYKINYKTPAPDGHLSLVSGLVLMPKSPTEPVDIVSYNHGTRVGKRDAPSSFYEKDFPVYATFGSSGGYMVVMADYLGFGDSELDLHPYVQADTLAQSSIDMLLAAKELAQQLNYPINDELYLTGYSEGGFTTIVMYESMLKNYPEISVTAVAPGSAPYDFDETIPFVALQPGPRATLYLAYFFYSMQTYKHYWPSLDAIFVKPYDTLVPELFDGYHTVPEILKALPQDPSLIFHASFFYGILDGTDEHASDLRYNFNHYDFKATSPLLLVGSKGDKDVPYHGAEIAYQQLKSKSDKVYIKHVSEVLDHVEAYPYVLKEQLEFFKSVNK